jgi:hypothetical protein
VVRYVRRQQEHHRKMTFEQEYIALFKETRHYIRSAICFWLRVVPRLWRSPSIIASQPTALPWATLWSRLRRSVFSLPRTLLITGVSRTRFSRGRVIYEMD